MSLSNPTHLNLIESGGEISPEDVCDCVHPKAVMTARGVLSGTTGMAGAAEIFSILGDPTRIRVLTALRGGELCVTDLAVATGVNRSTVSHQLRVLRSHRLVDRRREGKTVFYAIADEHVEALLDLACVHAAEESGGRAEVMA
jgi:DNA-binding transcriptional ArsR family regulator